MKRLLCEQDQADATLWQSTADQFVSCWESLPAMGARYAELAIDIFGGAATFLLILSCPISFPIMGWIQRRHARQKIAAWNDRQFADGAVMHMTIGDEPKSCPEPCGGRFVVGDRVRIRFGAARGEYGKVASKGGDDGTYYGVKSDGSDREIGYCDYELESVNTSIDAV